VSDERPPLNRWDPVAAGELRSLALRLAASAFAQLSKPASAANDHAAAECLRAALVALDQLERDPSQGGR
jgi:hypothetical protein